MTDMQENKPYMDYDGNSVFRCRNCGARIFHPSGTQADDDEKNYRKYCFACGKAIKWFMNPDRQKEET